MVRALSWRRTLSLTANCQLSRGAQAFDQRAAQKGDPTAE